MLGIFQWFRFWTKNFFHWQKSRGFREWSAGTENFREYHSPWCRAPQKFWEWNLTQKAENSWVKNSVAVPRQSSVKLRKVKNFSRNELIRRLEAVFFQFFCSFRTDQKHSCPSLEARAPNVQNREIY